MSRERLKPLINKMIGISLCIALILGVAAAAAAGVNSARLDSSSEFYPIALSAQSLQNVAIGDELADIYSGTEPGNFGWLSWSGKKNVPTMVKSLTPPGDSGTYVNPNNSDDSVVSVGDWVHGNSNSSNSRQIREALDTLKTVDIDVLVWDDVSGNGSRPLYRVADFARVRLTEYRVVFPGSHLGTLLGILIW